MGARLWFIGNENNKPLKVFPSRRSAEFELEAMIREDERAEEYTLYSRNLDELEEFPVEFSLAEEEGII